MTKFETNYQMLPDNIKNSEVLSLEAKKVIAGLLHFISNSNNEKALEGLIIMPNTMLKKISGVGSDKLKDTIFELQAYGLIFKNNCNDGYSWFENKRKKTCEYFVDFEALQKEIKLPNFFEKIEIQKKIQNLRKHRLGPELEQEKEVEEEKENEVEVEVVKEEEKETEIERKDEIVNESESKPVESKDISLNQTDKIEENKQTSTLNNSLTSTLEENKTNDTSTSNKIITSTPIELEESTSTEEKIEVKQPNTGKNEVSFTPTAKEGIPARIAKLEARFYTLTNDELDKTLEELNRDLFKVYGHQSKFPGYIKKSVDKINRMINQRSLVVF